MDNLERIQQAVLDQRYTFTEHAYDEMDAEAAILTGRIGQILTDDPRGVRFVVEGTACDQSTPVSVVMRFVEDARLLIITVYQTK